MKKFKIRLLVEQDSWIVNAENKEQAIISAARLRPLVEEDCRIIAEEVDQDGG